MSQKFFAHRSGRLVQPLSQKNFPKSHKKICFSQRNNIPSFGDGKQIQPFSLKTFQKAKTYRKKPKLQQKYQLHFKTATCEG